MYTPVVESNVVVLAVVEVSDVVVVLSDTCGQLVSAQNYGQLVVVVSVSSIECPSR